MDIERITKLTDAEKPVLNKIVDRLINRAHVLRRREYRTREELYKLESIVKNLGYAEELEQ